MPFGKHKGVLIADLPGNYLNWFAREGFPKGEIGRLLQLMQEIDHNGLGELLLQRWVQGGHKTPPVVVGPEGVEQVVVNAETIEGKAKPLYIYAAEKRGDTGTSA